MTDQQIMDIIRRRMAFVEHELSVDRPATPQQWSKAMTEYAEELARTFYKRPENVDVPHVGGGSAVGDTLTCTMGNWQGEPTGYTYQWQRDATDIGSGQNTYQVVSADAGHSITCLVTAENDIGPTTAPPSNAVEIPAGTSRASAHREEPSRSTRN